MDKEICVLMDDKKNNLSLAIECTKSFLDITGIGCVLSYLNGESIYEGGNTTAYKIACISGVSKELYLKVFIYNTAEDSSITNNKYMYCDSWGFKYLVGSIIDDNNIYLKITIGPFLMVDREHFIDTNLRNKFRLDDKHVDGIIKEVKSIPVVSNTKISSYLNLLNMSVGFLNNINKDNKPLVKDKSYEPYDNIPNLSMSEKLKDTAPFYPFDIENKLLECISKSNYEETKKYLNEILEFIFLYTGNNLLIYKSRIYELLTLISRRSINNGADPTKVLLKCNKYLNIISNIKSLDELYTWSVNTINDLVNNQYTYMDVKHNNIIYKAFDYIYKNYNKGIGLKDVAESMYISPAYFSRIFKKETGISFVDFLNIIRIEKGKDLIESTNMKIINISDAVGFEDQSYFTKVFKKKTGMTPAKYKQKVNSNRR